MVTIAAEKSLAVPQNVKLRVTLGPSNSILRYRLKGNENINPHKTLYTNVPSNLTASQNKAQKHLKEYRTSKSSTLQYIIGNLYSAIKN